MVEGKPKVLFVDKNLEMNKWAQRELGPFCELQLAATSEFKSAEEMIFWLDAKSKKFDAVILNPEITPADLISGGKFVPKVHAFKWLRKYQESHPETKVVIFHSSKPKPFPKGLVYVNSARGECFRKIRERLGVEPKRLSRRVRAKRFLKGLGQRLWRSKSRRV